MRSLSSRRRPCPEGDGDSWLPWDLDFTFLLAIHGAFLRKRRKKRGERRGGGVISRDCTFCVRASFVQNERARLRYEPVAPLALL